MSNQNSERTSVKVNGTIAAEGLPRLLGALWGLDLKDPRSVARLRTRYGSVMEESEGVIRFASGSFLIVRRSSFKRVSARKKRTTRYHIEGSVEEDDLHAIMNCGIECHWESNEDDEVGPCLTIDIQEFEATPLSIHPDSIPPSKS